MKDTRWDRQRIEYKISAVIPVYNREKTIRRCIDSILNQTYPIYEIVIVDDGSTDQTLHILKEYQDCIKLVRQKHKGAQAARNMGIREADGEYIAFLDSDDEWMPDKLELQVNALQKNKYAVICGGGYIQTEWKNGIPEVYRKSEDMQNAKSLMRLRLKGKSGYVYKFILQDSFCLFPSLMTSKENLIKIGLLDEKVPSFQEWDTAIRLAQTNELIYIDSPLFIYHLHDGETISKNKKKTIDGKEYIYEKYKYEILSKLGKRELVRRYKELMKTSWKYKDKRVLKYFLKYIMGRGNMFIFEGK